MTSKLVELVRQHPEMPVVFFTDVDGPAELEIKDIHVGQAVHVEKYKKTFTVLQDLYDTVRADVINEREYKNSMDVCFETYARVKKYKWEPAIIIYMRGKISNGLRDAISRE